MRGPSRAPVIVLILILMAGAIAVQTQRGSGVDVDAARIGEWVPTVAAADAVGATWYCAGGTATGGSEGLAEQTVIIANSSDEDRTARVTVVPDASDPVSVAVDIAAASRETVTVADVVQSEWAAVIVEVDGGGVSVAHELKGPTGVAFEDCASSPSSKWWFPQATSRNGTRLLLALFNPFPGEATVDLSFDTDDGARVPGQFQGLVIPGSRVLVVDVGAVVTLREQVATSVDVRSGRIVAEQIQTSDGREGTAAGLSAMLGAPTPASTCMFPVGTPVDTSLSQLISVVNTGSVDATVTVEVFLSDPARNGSVEPFELVVAPGRYGAVDIHGDPRVPRSVPHWLVVRSDGGEIVASQSFGGVADGGGRALAATMGVPLVARQWLLSPLDTEVAPVDEWFVAIANPSPTETVRVEISALAAGTDRPLTSGASVTIGPGEVEIVDLTTQLTATPAASIRLEADRPVIVGGWVGTTSPPEAMVLTGFVVGGTQSLPGAVIGPDVASLVGDGLEEESDTIPMEPEGIEPGTGPGSSTTLADGATDSTVAGATSTTAAPVP